MKHSMGEGKVADRNKSLHSMRHSAAVALKKSGCSDGVRHALLGHCQGTSVEDRVYLEGLRYSLVELRDGLEKMSLPVNITSHTARMRLLRG